MYTLKCSPFTAIWPFTNLPMAMKINCNANYAKKKKKNQRVRVKFLSAEFLICACGHLVFLSLGTVTFLSSLCWCFIPLPLWLPHWHLNAAFCLLTPFSFFFSSLFLSVWTCVGTEISMTAAYPLMIHNTGSLTDLSVGKHLQLQGAVENRCLVP